MSDQRFDELARTLARPISRRRAFQAMAGAAVSGFLLQRAPLDALAAGGNSDCAQFCQQLPPGQRGDCVSRAAHGGGPCYDCGPRGRNTGWCTTSSGLVCCNGPTPDCCKHTCVNLQNGPTNCGTCGNVCKAPANATSTCSGGRCGYTCAPGYADCDGVAANGCEINTARDVGNCGGCGTSCPVPANATATCTNGTCGFVCKAGFADCNRDHTDGCEANLAADASNCGGCGIACGQGQACVKGSCTPIAYTPGGVQQNVPVATVVAGGWTQCFSDTYDADLFPEMGPIVNQLCTKNKLMLACRQTGSSTLQLLAWAPRADVLFDTGQNQTTVHNANGVSWYFNNNYSWGFAPQGDSVMKLQCDITTNVDGDKRLCWHTIDFTAGGYRCGNVILTGDASYERVVFEAD